MVPEGCHQGLEPLRELRLNDCGWQLVVDNPQGSQEVGNQLRWRMVR